MLETSDPAAETDAMTRNTDPDTAPKPAGERRRPRKKLSFREPEIVGCEKYRQMKEVSEPRAESIIKAGRSEADGTVEKCEARPGPDGQQEGQQAGQQVHQYSDQQDSQKVVQQAGQLDDQQGDQQVARQNRHMNGGLAGQTDDCSDRETDGPVERQRGGSLDSHLSIRMLQRHSLARMDADPLASGLVGASSLGSIEDIELQDQALAIVRSVGLAFEVYHDLDPGPGPSAARPDDEDRPVSEPVSPVTVSSSSGDETPRPADAASTEAPDASSSKPPSPPTELPTSEDTPSPVGCTVAANSSCAERPRSCSGERPGRRQRHSRSPDKRHVSAAATTRRHQSLPRPPKAGGCSRQPLPQLFAGREPVSDGLLNQQSDRQSASLHHQMQLVRGQLARQQQQTQAAQAQVSLVRHQLQAETAARLQAQRRSHQLLDHNRQLLEHVQQLIGELQRLQAERSETVSPDTSFASLSSEEAVRQEPDRNLQLLWDLERLSAAPLSPLGQCGSPASPCSALERLSVAPLSPLSQCGSPELGHLASDPLFDLGQFSAAPLSPLARGDVYLSDLGGVSYVPLSPLAREEGCLSALGALHPGSLADRRLAGLSAANGGDRWRRAAGQGSGTLRRSAGPRHTAARYTP